MGLMKWLARRGSVGRIARWAGDGYLVVRGQHRSRASLSDREIFRMMVAARFQMHPDASGERLMLSYVDELNGLRGLVAAILTYETDFAKNTAFTRNMLMDVIAEELETKGIPRDVIFGRR
jgi:hypothetical protein